MSNPPPLVDIHCHLLPELDDGAAGWDETLAMARLAVADGISTVVATPHQLGAYARNHGDTIRRRTAQLQQFLRRHNVPLQVLPGADVRIEPEMLGKLQSGEVLSLADRRRHVLLELPHDVYFPLQQTVRELAAEGMIAVLSHPERNRGILRDRRVVPPLVEAGCLMQVTAGSLVGTFGPQVQRLGQWLLQQRLVHFVATDAHGAKSRRPLLRRAFRFIARLVGVSTAVDLCCRNPAEVAAGKLPAAGRSRPTLPASTGWLRWKKAG